MTSAIWERERRFKATFFAAYREPFGIRYPGQEWRMVTRPKTYITESAIRRHFIGLCDVGPVGRSFTKTITIDVDAHTQESCSTLEVRVRCAMSVFDVPPLVFSTPRGIHLVWLLENPTWAEKARAYGAAMMAKAGIKEKAGEHELYPKDGRALRAPLCGEGYLLDPDDLIPVGDKEVCIRTLDTLLMNDKIDRLVVPDEYEPHVVEKRRVVREPTEWMQRVDGWLYFGLDGPGERTEACLNLCWYYHVVMNHDSHTVVRDLNGWLAAKNNGCSTDYRRNPTGCFRHNERIVRRFDESKVAPRGKGGIGLEEAMAFLEEVWLNESARVLLAHIIVRALTRGQQVGEVYEVEIPSRTLQSWNRNYSIPLDLLIRRGHIQKTVGYTTRGRCQTYRVLTVPKSTQLELRLG